MSYIGRTLFANGNTTAFQSSIIHGERITNTVADCDILSISTLSYKVGTTARALNMGVWNNVGGQATTLIQCSNPRAITNLVPPTDWSAPEKFVLDAPVPLLSGGTVWIGGEANGYAALHHITLIYAEDDEAIGKVTYDQGSRTYADPLPNFNSESLEVDLQYYFRANTLIRPTGALATVNSPTQITLAWTDNADNEAGYRVQIKGGTYGDWTQYGADLAPGATSKAITGLAASTAYDTRVAAFHADGQGAWVQAAQVTTDAPPIISSDGNGLLLGVE